MIQFDPRASPPYDDEDDDDDDGEAGVSGRPKKRKSVANLRGAAAKESSGPSKPDADDPEEKGRRKIMIEYIEEKSKRHITFSKRKAGIMKKAYELSTLTGTQVLLLVVSESGWVYTFTTDKFKPLVKEDEHGQLSQGQKLIAACLEAKEPSSTPFPPTSTAAAFEANSAIHGGQIALKTNSRPQGPRPVSTNRRVSSKGRHHIPLAINTGHPAMPPGPPHGHPHQHPHHQLPTPMSAGYLDPSLGGMGIGGPISPRGRSRSGGGPPSSPHARGHPSQMTMQQAQAQQQQMGEQQQYDQILQRTEVMHMHPGGPQYDGGHQPQQYDGGMGYPPPPSSQAHNLSLHSHDGGHLPPQQRHPEPVYHHVQPGAPIYDYGQSQDPYRQMMPGGQQQGGQQGGGNYLQQGGQEGDR
ncbi:hypothetical protein RQP46_007073 [Phenoliferia psychrophenolica]